MKLLSSEARADTVTEGLGEERRELSIESGSQLRKGSNMEAQKQQSRNW